MGEGKARRDSLEISIYYHPIPSGSETYESISKKVENLFQEKKGEIGDDMRKYFEKVKIGKNKIDGQSMDVIDETGKLKLEPLERYIQVYNHPSIAYSENWIDLDYDTIKRAIGISEKIGKYINDIGNIKSEGNIELCFFKPKEVEKAKGNFEILEKVLEEGNYKINGVSVEGEPRVNEGVKENRTKTLELSGSVPIRGEILFESNSLGEPYKYIKVNYTKD